MSQLKNGKIPEGVVCPFIDECLLGQRNVCPRGKHMNEFSCGFARGLDVIKECEVK